METRAGRATRSQRAGRKGLLTLLSASGRSDHLRHDLLSSPAFSCATVEGARSCWRARTSLVVTARLERQRPSRKSVERLPDPQQHSAGAVREQHAHGVFGHAHSGLGLAQALCAKDGPKPDQGGSARNPEVNFKKQKRSNDTHTSASDPDARLATKSNRGEAMPAYMGHVLMENRSRLAMDTRLTRASGTAERKAAVAMLAQLPGTQRKTVGADKGYDSADFVADCAQDHPARGAESLRIHHQDRQAGSS